MSEPFRDNGLDSRVKKQPVGMRKAEKGWDERLDRRRGEARCSAKNREAKELWWDGILGLEADPN